MSTTDTVLAHPRTAIAIATHADRDALVATLAAAFESDPVARWFFPGELYQACFAPFTGAFGGGAFTHHSAYHTTDYSGAALWLPPETGPDEARMMEIIERTLEDEKRPTAFAIFEQMGHGHPDEPHWYLPVIGVAPQHQGRGIGSALLAAALAKCDEAGLTAYLESSNPRNIPLYRRHGFEITGEIRIGTCPPITPMTRPRQRQR
jgi:ribosomal protein S18 acetylase RimI-like enzyme